VYCKNYLEADRVYEVNIKIVIATHKKYWMPQDKIYLPLQVGRSLHAPLGYMNDSQGDNISNRNESFCELTGLYWVWKNVQADYKGLVHYRRHFTNRCFWKNSKDVVYTGLDFERAFTNVDIILPSRRRYYIETNQTHYAHAHYNADILITRESICRQCPQYLEQFDYQMERTSAHMFNMMVMRSDYFDSYCAWLFKILFDVEQHTDISHYSAVQGRLYGYLSELLLDVWIETNQLPYKEVHVSFMEPQNWLKKGGGFLLRKFWNVENYK
jgi:hypothetical protein